MELTNQTILITGGSSGIGLELGKALKKNNTVILMGSQAAKLQPLEASGFRTICCDLANPDEIESAVLTIEQKFPALTILVNNAGVQDNYPFVDTVVPAHRIQREVSVNLTGQMILTQRLIPLLASNVKESLIINTTSGLGLFPKSDGVVYSATKAAMRNFTIALRYALKSAGVRVMEFIPPVTDTPMTQSRQEAKANPQKLALAALSQIRKGRKTVTVPSIRMFIWISFLFPRLAHRILAK